jgi:hypothetical protein
LHHALFLFIRGLSCPRSVRPSLTQNCLTAFVMFLVVTLDLKKHRPSIGLEIRPQSDFTAFRALLPSAYSAV